MTPQEAWEAAYNQLELQMDRGNFSTWIKDTAFLCYEDGVFVIGAPNPYARDMLEFRLYRNIRRVLTDCFGKEIELRFELVSKLPPREPEMSRRRGALTPDDEEMPLFRFMAQQSPSESAPRPLHERVSRPQRPALPDSDLNPRFNFDRFIVGNSSRAVYEAARAVAENPGATYNPLLVYGGVGLGKTHLLQAVGNVCAAKGLAVAYVSSEAFMNDLIDAIRTRTTAMFRERYRTLDVLLVDDIQFIAGKDSTQEEFFHTFNALWTFNKQIVLASDRHPRELTTLEDRLRSRFSGGLVMDLQPPELETRIAILRMWSSERNIALPQDVLALIAEHAPPNLRELEGAFNQVIAKTRHGGGSFSTRQVESILEKHKRPRQHNKQRATIESVILATAQCYNLTPDDLTGKGRQARVNEARQVAMWLCRELTESSLPQIGEYFGGRSHTTVLHGLNKIAEDMEVDPAINQRVRSIYDALCG